MPRGVPGLKRTQDYSELAIRRPEQIKQEPVKPAEGMDQERPEHTSREVVESSHEQSARQSEESKAKGEQSVAEQQRAERLQAVREAVAKEGARGAIGERGAAVEVSRLTQHRQDKTNAVDLNDNKISGNGRNFPCVDIATKADFESAKSHGTDVQPTERALKQYTRDASALRTIDQNDRARSRILSSVRGVEGSLKEKGCWPEQLGSNPTDEQILAVVKDSKLVIPDNHVENVREHIASNAAFFPENYGFDPNSPTLPVEIDKFVQTKIVGSGCSTTDYREGLTMPPVAEEVAAEHSQTSSTVQPDYRNLATPRPEGTATDGSITPGGVHPASPSAPSPAEHQPQAAQPSAPIVVRMPASTSPSLPGTFSSPHLSAQGM